MPRKESKMSARRNPPRKVQLRVLPFVPVTEIPAVAYCPDEEMFPSVDDDFVPDELSTIDPEVLEIFAEAAELGGRYGHVAPVFPEDREYELQDAEYYLG